MPAENRGPFRFSHQSMGTVFEALIAGTEAGYAGQVSQAVFGEIDRFENLFSRYNPCSEIGQINNLQSGQTLPVSVDVFECLLLSLRIEKQTGGAFNIHIDSGLKSDPASSSRIPIELEHTSKGYFVRYIANKRNQAAAGPALDLGGIGKGFALDKAARILSDWSVGNALIHGGTSTAFAFGRAPGFTKGKKGWPTGVGGNWPCLEGQRLFLSNRALSGSGTDVKGRHIVDPRTGGEASGHLAAWVSHPSAAWADALSTAFMVMDRDEVKAFCDLNPQVWALVLIDPGRYEVYNETVVDRNEE